MKRFLSVFLSVLLVFLLAACGESTGETVAVKEVRDIIKEGSVGYVDRYAGVVVSGETANVKKDSGKTVLEVLVAEGDIVSEGDVLFTYDTRAMEIELEKLNLEYEELQNTISSAEENIPILEKKAKRANATDMLGYNLQIQSLKADILESTYKLNLKERDIAAMEEAMNHIEVTAPISGRVMSVKDTENSNGSGSGDISSQDADAFITITDVGTLRVKGNINELNVGTLSEGIPVIIRARSDESVTWTGFVEKIDWETTVNSNNNSMYYGGSDEMTSSSKYPFYITLDATDGLLMGQHVYIEPDYGQAGEKEGVWLPSYYLFYQDDQPCVWAQNGRGKLELRRVELGLSDEEAGTVEILSGLSEDDSIAFPEENVTEGMNCVPYEELMFSEEDADGDMMTEEGMG